MQDVGRVRGGYAGVDCFIGGGFAVGVFGGWLVFYGEGETWKVDVSRTRLRY